MEKVKLYIGIPSNRDWKGKFGSCLASLTSYLTGNGIKAEGYELESFFMRAIGQSSCISIARQAMVDEMIAGGYTHYLPLDDDMTFPMDIVDRLIVHGKDVVAINARHKIDEVKGSLVGLDGQRVNSTDKEGLEEILAMGGAIFLARTACFKNIPKPHFQVIWSPQHNDYVSEDIYFASLLKSNGVKLWCDHDTSRLVKHIGDHEYGWPTLETVAEHKKKAA